MSDIKFDPKNYRIHTDSNKRIIRKSLEDCGAGRSVLVDKENVLIAGNGVYEQAQELGLKVRIVESDGKELIVVKRNDLSSADDKRKLLALADNHASDTSMFDIDMILEDFTEEVLALWEMSIDDIKLEEFEENETESSDDKIYTKKIVSPIYTPTGDKPIIDELFNLEKFHELLSEIDSSDLDEEIKGFLRFAAHRHVSFNYGKIAEFYAHSNKEIQELMEDSALVIIDFNKAIELGYAKLKEDISEQFSKEYSDDEE